MAKVKKALLNRLDPHFSVDRKTGERYKVATLKILECDDSNLVNKEATLYINKKTKPEFLLSLQMNIYWFNFVVDKVGCCNHYVDQRKVLSDFYCSLDGDKPLTDTIAKTLALGESFIGKEYSKALEQVFAIRMDRYSQYGDSYLEDSYESLINQVRDKTKRIELNIKSGGTSYENSVDSAIDAVNYSLFILSKLITNSNE